MTYVCLIQSLISKIPNHTKVNFSNIFDLMNKRIELENNKCLIIKIGLWISQSTSASDCVSFIDEVKKMIILLIHIHGVLSIMIQMRKIILMEK